MPSVSLLLDNGTVEPDKPDCAMRSAMPAEAVSSDPDVLRAALVREHDARQRADCLAAMQAEVVQLALDLLVREPDIEGFFGGLTKTMVEDTESHGCGVWLLDDERTRCELWMAYRGDRLYLRRRGDLDSLPFPHDSLGHHLMAYTPGGPRRSSTERTIRGCRRLCARSRRQGRQAHDRHAARRRSREPRLDQAVVPDAARVRDASWWRIVLIEAIARQAALALHHNRVVERSRLEERRKAMLEERNRLARDIHDNLAQGFGAILMQLQAAQREGARVPPGVAAKLDTAVDLARTHMVEARRSVGALRPNVGRRRGYRRR